SAAGGIGFLALLPLVEPLFRMIGHDPAVQVQEILYLRCLCFAALPALIVASINSFFAGRGETWIVAVIDATGMTLNAVLAYGLIFGHWGLPELGIRGAGWATVIGSAVSALLGLALFFQTKYRARFRTLSGWRFDPELFRRMMRFGLPNGVQAMLDGLSFTIFLSLLGQFGKDDLAASNIAFAINIVGLVPM